MYQFSVTKRLASLKVESRDRKVLADVGKKAGREPSKLSHAPATSSSLSLGAAFPALHIIV